MFDLVSGFVHTQCLTALVSLGTLDLLADEPRTLRHLASSASVPLVRMQILLNAGIALGLLTRNGERFGLTVRGAALTGVPGLRDMIKHHAILYRDLSDPVAFFRGETNPELAEFWPYVFGDGAAEDPGTAARYSRLMADSQALVADETLGCVNLTRHSHLLDVGGGTGAFLTAALRVTPGLKGTLFDLPAVTSAARERFGANGLDDRITIVPGSFRDQALPQGADVISLIRVLYDHADQTVAALLLKARDALPENGQLIVSEPMTGGASPSRAGDAYFAIYTLAMQTGRARSPQAIVEAVKDAGFVDVRHRRTCRPFVTTVVTARKRSK